MNKAVSLLLALVFSLFGITASASEVTENTGDADTISTVLEDEKENPAKKTPLTAIFNYDLLVKGRIIPVNDSSEWEDTMWEWKVFFSSVAAYNELEDEVLLELESMNINEVDISVAGDYTVTAKFRLSDEDSQLFTISEELCTLRIPVYICDPKKFNLRVLGATKLNFTLYYITELAEEPTVLWVESSSPLEEEALNTVLWDECPKSTAFAGGNTGSIMRSGLTVNSHYYFRLKSGDMYSDIIYILDDGTHPSYDYMGGDRDGGDTDGNTPPDVIIPTPPSGGDGSGSDDTPTSPPSLTATPKPSVQPTTTPAVPDESEPPKTPGLGLNPNETATPEVTVTPTPLSNPKPNQTQNPSPVPGFGSASDSSESPAPTPIKNPDNKENAPAAAQPIKPIKAIYKEEISETFSRISGFRLRMMLENGDAVFSKQGVTLTFSQKVLKELAHSDEAEFFIEIKRLDENKFSFAVWVDDTEITAFADTGVELPYTAADDNNIIELINESGSSISTGLYNPENKLISFTVNSSGLFTIVENNHLESPIPPKSDVSAASNQLKNNTEYKAAVLIITVVIGTLALCGGLLLFRRRRRK